MWRGVRYDKRIARCERSYEVGLPKAMSVPSKVLPRRYNKAMPKHRLAELLFACLNLQRLTESVVLHAIADDDELAVAHDFAIIHYPISIIRTDVLEVGLY